MTENSKVFLNKDGRRAEVLGDDSRPCNCTLNRLAAEQSGNPYPDDYVSACCCIGLGTWYEEGGEPPTWPEDPPGVPFAPLCIPWYEPTVAEKERKANTVRWREEQRQRRSDAWRQPAHGDSRQERRRAETADLKPRLRPHAGKQRRWMRQSLRAERPGVPGRGSLRSFVYRSSPERAAQAMQQASESLGHACGEAPMPEPIWKDFESYAMGFEVRRRGSTIAVTLLYPPWNDADAAKEPGKPRYVEFDQESTRASDGIRIHYDYERDGYAIEQSSRFTWASGDTVCAPDWQEVAFVQAWGSEETAEQEEARLLAEPESAAIDVCDVPYDARLDEALSEQAANLAKRIEADIVADWLSRAGDPNGGSGRCRDLSASTE